MADNYDRPWVQLDPDEPRTITVVNPAGDRTEVTADLALGLAHDLVMAAAATRLWEDMDMRTAQAIERLGTPPKRRA